MRLNAVNILEISITSSPKNIILEYIKKYLTNTSKLEKSNPKLRVKPLVIVTPNPEQVIYGRTHPEFKKILNRADVALPDGIGIIKAAQMLGVPIEGGRVSGVDMMRSLAALSAELGARIGLIGGRGGVALESLECLKSTLAQESRGTYHLEGWATDGPELEVMNQGVGIRNQEKNEEWQDVPMQTYIQTIVGKIITSNTRMVFVGLGAPKQEYIIEAVSSQLSAVSFSPIVFMAVGGSMDILSGRIRRAPRAVQSLGLEWLWRLILEPWRLGRQLVLLEYIWLVVCARSKMGRGTLKIDAI